MSVPPIPAGRFVSSDTRRAAVRRALPVLGTYVAGGISRRLDPFRDVSESEEQDRSVLDLAGLRVVLANARRLTRVIDDLEARSNFRYERRTDEHIGQLRGRLDVQRYAVTRHMRVRPRRYPVRIVERTSRTPENELVAASALAVLLYLRRVPRSISPRGGAEDRERRTLTARLERSLEAPPLVEAKRDALSTVRAGQISRLADEVKRRIATGRVKERALYSAAVSIAEKIAGIRVELSEGDLEWLIYGDADFDTKLFELWVLQCTWDALLDAFSETAGSAELRPLNESSSDANGLIQLPTAEIEVWFQKSLSGVNVSMVPWRREENGNALEGIPDVSLIVSLFGGERTPILVDAKLRQRYRLPSDEVYKILGYFETLARGSPRFGAIVFYTPGSTVVYSLRRDADPAFPAVASHMLAIGVDPLENVPNPLQAIASLVLEVIGVEHSTGSSEAVTGPPGDEAAVAARQAANASMLLEVGQRLPAEVLAPHRRLLSVLIGESGWAQLDVDTQTMMVSAEYFGSLAPDGADHSGALLGFCAACERVLVAKLPPARFPGSGPPRDATIGEAVACLRIVCRLKSGEAPEAVDPAIREYSRAWVGELMAHFEGCDMSTVEPILSSLSKLNARYRIPVAHGTLTELRGYLGGRQLVVGVVDEPGLCARILDALPPREAESGAEEVTPGLPEASS